MGISHPDQFFQALAMTGHGSANTDNQSPVKPSGPFEWRRGSIVKQVKGRRGSIVKQRRESPGKQVHNAAMGLTTIY